MIRLRIAVCAAPLLGTPIAAPAQPPAFPSKPIRIIAPFPPGAGTVVGTEGAARSE